MQKKFLYVVFMFFSYAIAMDEDEESREQALNAILEKKGLEFYCDHKDAATEERLFKWINNACKKLGLSNEELQGYNEGTNYIGVHGSLLKGVRTELLLSKILEKEALLKSNTHESSNGSESPQEDLKKKIAEEKSLKVSCYKINGMPGTLKEYKKMVKRLIFKIVSDEELQKAMSSFKLQPAINFSQSLEEIAELLEAKSATGGIMPILVVYPGNGKDHAQYTLNTLYKLYEDLNGLELVPRFSKEIRKGLSYTHGNGDEKISKYGHCFTRDFIFYHNTFENLSESVNYHLNDPTQQQQNQVV